MKIEGGVNRKITDEEISFFSSDSNHGYNFASVMIEAKGMIESLSGMYIYRERLYIIFMYCLYAVYAVNR
jgi:hypothetical protein